MRRLWLCIGATLLIVLGGGMTAFAGNRPPSVTPTLATFTVAPRNPAGDDLDIEPVGPRQARRHRFGDGRDIDRDRARHLGLQVPG